MRQIDFGSHSQVAQVGKNDYGLWRDFTDGLASEVKYLKNSAVARSVQRAIVQSLLGRGDTRLRKGNLRFRKRAVFHSNDIFQVIEICRRAPQPRLTA